MPSIVQLLVLFCWTEASFVWLDLAMNAYSYYDLLYVTHIVYIIIYSLFLCSFLLDIVTIATKTKVRGERVYLWGRKDSVIL